MSENAGAPRPITRRENHDKVIELLASQPRGRVLDAPCGQGALALRLVELGFEVDCCDIDTAAFRVEGLPVQYAELNLGKIPHEDATFDYVASVNGLHRLWNPGNAVAEYARVLKPGGLLVCSIPNYAHLSRRLRFLFLGGIARNVSRMGVHRRLEDPASQYRTTLLYSQVEEWMLENGLEIEGLASARRKRTGLVLYPLALLIRAVGRLASARSRRAYAVDRSNSAAILLGSHHLFLLARKRS